MARTRIGEVAIEYEVVGEGRPWVITPGGRFSKDSPGVRELAAALAERGNRVLIWDRPNCGASDVCFTGPSESAMQADILAGLLVDLDMAPAVIAGGSGGSRVSLLTAARHREVAAGLAMWWISGGVYGLMILGVHYCGGSLTAAWNGGMEAVAKLPEWAEVLERNPANRQRFGDQDPGEFIATMERWMAAYCPCGDELVPGLPDAEARRLDVPALVFRSGASDFNHTRATSEQLAGLLPNARLVEPPWGDSEWNERSAARPGGRGEGLFVGWPRLAPALQAWADELKPSLPDGDQAWARGRAAERRQARPQGVPEQGWVGLTISCRSSDPVYSRNTSVSGIEGSSSHDVSIPYRKATISVPLTTGSTSAR
jgi:pimeloyl-ACP methyl ester carboxylesterase